MQININIKGLDAVKKQLQALSPAQMHGAISMAINKTAEKGRTEITRAITDRYAISANEVRNSVNIYKAFKGSSSTVEGIKATISVFGSPSKLGRSMNMIHFVNRSSAAKTKKRGKDGKLNQLRFKIKKSSGNQVIPGSFIGNDGRTVFERVGKGRLPIRPVQVIGVSQMFMFRPVHDRVIKRITDEFNVELNRAIAQKIRAAR